MSIIYSYGKPVSMESLGRTIQWRKNTAFAMKTQAEKISFIGYRELCPICASKESSDYLHVHNFTYKQCLKCGHLYQYQIPEEATIQKLYADSSSYLAHMVDERFFQKRISMFSAPKVKFCSERIPHSQASEWLDIGCGGCELLCAARDAGWHVRGIEAGNIGVEQGKKLNIPVEQQYITRENANHLLKAPHIISLFDVIEHIPQPLEVLKLITAAAETCNYLVIEVPHHPSLSAFVARLFPQEPVRHVIVPDHIHIFTEKSLATLLGECGFHITHCWKFGQDFYEAISMLTQQAKAEIDTWPQELFAAVNDAQRALDQHGLSDTMLVIAQRNA